MSGNLSGYLAEIYRTTGNYSLISSAITGKTVWCISVSISRLLRTRSLAWTGPVWPSTARLVRTPVSGSVGPRSVCAAGHGWRLYATDWQGAGGASGAAHGVSGGADGDRADYDRHHRRHGCGLHGRRHPGGHGRVDQ